MAKSTAFTFLCLPILGLSVVGWIAHKDDKNAEKPYVDVRLGAQISENETSVNFLANKVNLEEVDTPLSLFNSYYPEFVCTAAADFFAKDIPNDWVLGETAIRKEQTSSEVTVTVAHEWELNQNIEFLNSECVVDSEGKLIAYKLDFYGKEMLSPEPEKLSDWEADYIENGVRSSALSVKAHVEKSIDIKARDEILSEQSNALIGNGASRAVCEGIYLEVGRKMAGARVESDLIYGFSPNIGERFFIVPGEMFHHIGGGNYEWESVIALCEASPSGFVTSFSILDDDERIYPLNKLELRDASYRFLKPFKD